MRIPCPGLVPLAAASALACPLVYAQQPFDVVWEVQTNVAPEGPDQVLALTPGEGGALLALGSAIQAGTTQFYVASYTGAGALQWSLDLAAPGSLFSLRDLGSDGAGGAFVVGSIDGEDLAPPSLGSFDVLLLHVTAQGTLDWVQRLGGSGYEAGLCLVPDGLGGCFVGGFTEGGSLFGGSAIGPRDGFVAHLDGQGSLSWAQPVGAPGKHTDLRAMASDGQGGLVATGPVFDPALTDARVLALRMDSSGTTLWQQRNLLSDALPQAIDGAPGGGCVIAGQRSSASGLGFVLALGPQGVLQWQASAAAPSQASSEARGLGVAALTGGGALLVGDARNTGSGSHWFTRYAARFDDQGQRLWEYPFPTATPFYGEASCLLLDGTGNPVVGGYLQDGASHRSWLTRLELEPFDQPGCAGVTNSTGQAAQLGLGGSDLRTDNAVTVYAQGLPKNQFALFLASPSAAFVPNPGGSQGNLCLGGPIGRFNAMGQLQQSGKLGRIWLDLDLDALPTPTGTRSLLAGQPWHFQAWYRDNDPGPTSNFSSSAVLVTQ